MLKKIKLSSIKPNPYRDFSHYPIQEERIEALRESIQATSFWGETIIARPAGRFYELAYGHHRWQAALKEFGKAGEVTISIRDLSDSQMLQMMARENCEMYAVNAAQDLELVKATLEAIDRGEVELQNKGPFSAKLGDYIESKKWEPTPFSTKELAKFLGLAGERRFWRVKVALQSLKYIQENLIRVSDYDSLSVNDAGEINRIIHGAIRAEIPKAKTRSIAKGLAKGRREGAFESGAGGGTVGGIRALGMNLIREYDAPTGKPDISKYARTLSREFYGYFTGPHTYQLKEIYKYRRYLNPEAQMVLWDSLTKLSKQAAVWADKFEPKEIDTSNNVARLTKKEA